MTRGARWAYVILAWAFLVGLVVQVFTIGLALFAGSQNLALHVNLGWILHLVPLLILLAAVLSRVGRRHWTWALALALVVFTVPIFVFARDTAPVLAALHPVVALASFWLAIVVARQSVEAVRHADAPSPAVAEVSA